MPEYLPRIVDRELELRLQASGATLIVGPKWCGKTTTGEQKAKSVLKMQDPDKKDGYLATAAVKPSLLLKGENPRLIDEWQIAPVLWDAVRTAVDLRQEDGVFILHDTCESLMNNEQVQKAYLGVDGWESCLTLPASACLLPVPAPGSARPAPTRLLRRAPRSAPIPPAAQQSV